MLAARVGRHQLPDDLRERSNASAWNASARRDRASATSAYTATTGHSSHTAPAAAPMSAALHRVPRSAHAHARSGRPASRGRAPRAPPAPCARRPGPRRPAPCRPNTRTSRARCRTQSPRPSAPRSSSQRSDGTRKASTSDVVARPPSRELHPRTMPRDVPARRAASPQGAFVGAGTTSASTATHPSGDTITGFTSSAGEQVAEVGGEHRQPRDGARRAHRRRRPRPRGPRRAADASATGRSAAGPPSRRTAGTPAPDRAAARPGRRRRPRARAARTSDRARCRARPPRPSGAIAATATCGPSRPATSS